MSRIHTITHPHGVQRLDLIHVRGIWKPNGPGKWNIGMGSEYEDFTIDPTEGAALEAAWLAFHGEHAPRPAEAGPELPAGWAFAPTIAGDTYASAAGEGWVGVSEHGMVGASSAPPEVVLAVIAAHRARVGGCLVSADILPCLPATVAELVDATGYDYETILAALRRLEAQRRVTKSKHGRTVVWSES
jgi:hypothetical protein